MTAFDPDCVKTQENFSAISQDRVDKAANRIHNELGITPIIGRYSGYRDCATNHVRKNPHLNDDTKVVSQALIALIIAGVSIISKPILSEDAF